jgi:MFS family permease
VEADKKRKSSLILTSLGAFFLLASYGILMGALPAELAARKTEPTHIGLVVGFYALGAVCFRVFALNAVDRIGARKTAAMASLCGLLSSLSLGMTMLLFDAVPAMLAVTNFVHGLATSAFLTAGYTYAAQAGEPEKRGTRIGIYGSLASLGMLVPPPVGIWLWSQGPGTHLWLLPFFLTIPAVFLLPGHQRSDHSAPEEERDQVHSFALLASRAVLPPILALAVSALMQGGFEAHMPFLIVEFEARSIMVQLYAFFGISVATGRLMGGWLSDRLGTKQIFFTGLICQMFALVLPLTIPTANGLLSSAAMFGVGSGAVGTVAIALLAAAVPGHRSGAAIGLGGMLRDVGFAAGAAATGIVLSIGGANAFLLLGVVATMFACALGATIYRTSGGASFPFENRQ